MLVSDSHKKVNMLPNMDVWQGLQLYESLVIVTGSFEDGQLWDCAKITEHLSCRVESYLHCRVLGYIIRDRIGRH